MNEEPILDTRPKAGRPRINRESEKELDKVEAQFSKFHEEVKELTTERMNMREKPETELKMSQNEINNSKEIYLKPSRVHFSREKFNEKYRDDYTFMKEYVNFVAQNNEIQGEKMDVWTKPFPGCPAEWWEVPANKPVWGPRYLAEQIKRKYYHRLKMDESKAVSSDGNATYYGQMSVDTVTQRLDAHPVTKKKSIFMGGNF